LSSGRTGVTGRAAWGVGDQVFSSATNFTMNILIARTLGASTFGAFSIAFGAYVIFLNISRALTSEPLSIRFSHVTKEEWAHGSRQAAGVALVIGVVAGLVSLAIASITNGDLRSAFLALGLVLPGLLYQDVWRHAFFASRQGGRSLTSDAIWAVVMFPALVLVLSTPEPSLLWLVLAWGVAATIAGVAVSILWGGPPALGRIADWLRDHRDLTPHFVGELATASVAGQLSLIGIGMVADLATVGVYRAAHILFGPIRVIYVGLALFGVPEAVRVLGRSVRRLRLTSKRAALVLAATALTFGVGLASLPMSLGELLLGETWVLVEPLIIPFTIGIVGVGISMPPRIGLRALEAAKQGFRTRLSISTGDLIFTIVGASVGGALGAAWAGRSFGFSGSGLWWFVYDRELRKREEQLAVRTDKQ